MPKLDVFQIVLRLGAIVLIACGLVLCCLMADHIRSGGVLPAQRQSNR